MMRASPRRVVKSMFVVSMLGFLIINFNLFMDNEPDVTSSTPAPAAVDTKQIFKDAMPPDKNGDDSIDYAIPPRHLAVHANNSDKDAPPPVHDPVVINKPGKPLKNSKDISELLKFPGRHAHAQNSSGHAVTVGRQYVTVGTDPTDIKHYIAQVNKAQQIRNTDRFDLPSSENSIVIVIQVHNRTEYLKLLIESFRTARHIENTILIFSHDYFSDEVNQLIFDIDFCLVSTCVCTCLICIVITAIYINYVDHPPPRQQFVCLIFVFFFYSLATRFKHSG